MALLHYKWSRVAGSNATADANVGWSEGQSPSSVNDSARAMMASAAGFRDDISGAIITGGTSTALTVSTYQVFDSLPNMGGHMVAFTPHTTNGATVTLNCDGLGAKPLRTSTGVELLAGTLIAGTPYTCTYNSSDQVFYLHGFYGNPYSVPLGGMLPFIGSTAPNSSFVFPYGQAISRTTYSTLFTLVSTTYGAGDGSATFNIPDLRGRVFAGKDDMGGSAASRLTSTYFGTSAAALGAVGGSESHTLTAGQTAAHTHTVTVTDPGHAHTGMSLQVYSTTSNNGGSAPSVPTSGQVTSTTSATTGITAAANANTGGGGAHNNVQPSLIGNFILRII